MFSPILGLACSTQCHGTTCCRNRISTIVSLSSIVVGASSMEQISASQNSGSFFIYSHVELTRKLLLWCDTIDVQTVLPYAPPLLCDNDSTLITCPISDKHDVLGFLIGLKPSSKSCWLLGWASISGTRQLITLCTLLCIH